MKKDEDEGCCFGKDIVLLLKMLLTLFKIYYLRSYLQLSKQTWRLKIAQIERHLSPERSRTIPCHRQEEKKRKRKEKRKTEQTRFYLNNINGYTNEKQLSFTQGKAPTTPEFLSSRTLPFQ